jgi:hypothetical protein
MLHCQCSLEEDEEYDNDEDFRRIGDIMKDEKCLFDVEVATFALRGDPPLGQCYKI